MFLSRREIALWVVIGGGERGTQGKKERYRERREEETGEIAWLGLCGMIVFLTGK